MCMGAVVNHYKENECMRLSMEELLYDNGVDVILNGHCHEYERSNPVYVSNFGKAPSHLALCCAVLCCAVLDQFTRLHEHI